MAEYKVEYTVTFDFKNKDTKEEFIKTASDWQTVDADSEDEANEIIDKDWEDALEDDWVSVPEEFFDDDYYCSCTNLDVDSITLVEPDEN